MNKKLVELFVGLTFLLSIPIAQASVIYVNATANAECVGPGGPANQIGCSLVDLSQTAASGYAGDTFYFDYELNGAQSIQLGTDVYVDTTGSLEKGPAQYPIAYEVDMALSDENGLLITDWIDVYERPYCPPGASNCTWINYPIGTVDAFADVLFYDVHFRMTTSTSAPDPLAIDVEIAEIKFISSFAPVPEPSALLLMAIGLVGLGFASRNKRASSTKPKQS